MLRIGEQNPVLVVYEFTNSRDHVEEPPQKVQESGLEDHTCHGFCARVS